MQQYVKIKMKLKNIVTNVKSNMLLHADPSGMRRFGLDTNATKNV